MLLSTSCSVLPYRVVAKNLQESPYEEGFRSVIEYTTYPSNGVIDAVVESTGDNVGIGSNRDSNNSSGTRIQGFSGLLASPTANEKPLDIFSQSKSGTDCKSYGYTNSQGNLCMDSQQIALLRSRGGNATGLDANIGLSV